MPSYTLYRCMSSAGATYPMNNDKDLTAFSIIKKDLPFSKDT